MKNSKFFELFCQFPDKELIELDRFLAKNRLVFPKNSRKRCLELWTNIKKNKTKIQAGEVGSPELFFLVTGKNELNENLFKKWLSHLYKAAEEFIIHREASQSPLLRQALLISGFNSGNFEGKAVRSSISKAKKIASSPPGDTESLLFRQIVFQESAVYQGRTQKVRDRLRDLLPAQKWLEEFYQTQKTKLEIAQLNQAHVFGEVESEIEINGIPTTIRKLLLRTKKLLTDSEDRDLDYLIRELLKKDSPLKYREKAEIWASTLNILIRKINSGEDIRKERLLELYDVFFRKIGPGLSMPVLNWHRKNYQTLIIKLNKDSFIDNWAEELSSHQSPLGFQSFTLGLWAFGKRDFTRARKYFSTLIAKKVDPFYGLNARVNISKCFFEEEKPGELARFLSRFRKYLLSPRGVDTTYYEKFILNLIALESILSNSRANHFKSELKSFQKNMSPSTPEKEWFDEVIKNYTG